MTSKLAFSGLLLLLFISAIGVVVTKHHNRALVTELQSTRVQIERLDVEWAQLRLEEATLSHHAKIEQQARVRLGMAEPERIVIVEKVQ